MTRRMMIVGFLLVGWAVCGLAVAGQDRTDPGAVPPKVGRRVRENLITLKLLRMTQALDLTTEQTSEIYPVLTRQEKEKYEITEKLNQSMKDLRLLLEQEKPDEARILSVMSEIGVWRDRIAAKDKEMADFLKPRLSVVQNAKYLLFASEFYQRLGERLGRIRQGGNKFRFTS